MKTCIIVIGNIASGKTTATLEFLEYDFKVVSADSIRQALNGGKHKFDKKLESIVWSCEFHLFKLLLHYGLNVIVDATNLTKSYRKRYLNHLKNEYPEYQRMVIVMPRISLRETLKRKKALGATKEELNAWRDVYLRYDKLMEPPTDEEDFHEVVYQ